MATLFTLSNGPFSAIFRQLELSDLMKFGRANKLLHEILYDRWIPLILNIPKMNGHVLYKFIRRHHLCECCGYFSMNKDITDINFCETCLDHRFYRKAVDYGTIERQNNNDMYVPKIHYMDSQKMATHCHIVFKSERLHELMEEEECISNDDYNKKGDISDSDDEILRCLECHARINLDEKNIFDEHYCTKCHTVYDYNSDTEELSD